MVKANCLYNSPVIPPTNAVGIKTAINTKTTPTTGPVISPIACSTASLDEYFPVSSKRVEFSTTTIASSTTMAIANTKPKRVSIFTENPNKCMTAKVQISDTGMVRDGIITARQFCKNNKITSMTSNVVSTNVTNTSSIEADTKSVVSRTTSYRTPVGKFSASFSISARTCFETLNAFEPGDW